MRIDLFAVWFMGGLVGSHLDKGAVFKFSFPVDMQSPSALAMILPSHTLPLAASHLAAIDMDRVSGAILS